MAFWRSSARASMSGFRTPSETSCSPSLRAMPGFRADGAAAVYGLDSLSAVRGWTQPLYPGARPLLARRNAPELVRMNDFKGKRVVVLGGAGFLGSHLCERLLREGADEVLSLDNFVTGDPRNVARLDVPGDFMSVGMTSPTACDRGAGGLRVQPGLAGLARSTTRSCPIETLRVGSMGTRATACGWRSEKGAVFLHGLHIGDLRRSARAPAAGGLLGQREPDRPARRATTRPSASPRPSSWRTTAPTASTRASRASSTRTGRGCALDDGRVVPAFVARRCAASDSRCSATARRRARSAT